MGLPPAFASRRLIGPSSGSTRPLIVSIASKRVTSAATQIA
jgi:hypothetical protein